MSPVTDLTPDDVAVIADEAYIYLFPLVLMDVTRRLTTSVPAGVRPGMGPMNVFSHMRAFPPGDFREVVRPNYDTLYSILWFDLRDGPVLVHVPDTAGRYYILPVMDMWTDVFATVGSRTTGTTAGVHAIVGPGWAGEVPGAASRIDAPTAVGWIIGRTRTDGPADYDAVHRIQDGFRVTTLGGGPAPPLTDVTPLGPEIDPSVAPLDAVVAMPGRVFFDYGLHLMTLHAPHLTDQPIIARMSRLGLRTGSGASVDALAPDILAALDRAPASAHRRIDAATPRLTPIVNGWVTSTSGMGVYGTDYLRRAVIAKVGLGANLVDDAIYPVLVVDATGVPPVGEHDYVLHFPQGQTPPADAFWSVTMYDGEGFPVPNAIERYALGDRDPLVTNPDGSLDVYIQHDDPGPGRRDNWLPAPRGPLGITLRIYAPRPEALDGRWTPPPLVRADR